LSIFLERIKISIDYKVESWKFIKFIKLDEFW
jgi:hypothetical protein